QAARPDQGDEAGLEKGDRPSRRGPGDPDLRGGTGLMALKKYKPTSPGRRFMSVSSCEEITKTEPEKSLTAPIKKTGGRNVNGRITTRHRAGATSAATGSSTSSAARTGSR